MTQHTAESKPDLHWKPESTDNIHTVLCCVLAPDPEQAR